MFTILYKFWHGRVSLWKAYWLVGELLNALVLLFFFNLEIYIFNNEKLTQAFPLLYLNNFNIFSKLVYFLWSFFITVGIWKSAENYKGNFVWIFLTLIVLSYRIFTMRLILFN